jgi:hypothetical protein
MDVVLLTVTTLSLAAAALFGVLAWRANRDERERESARVAALSAAMGPSAPRNPLLDRVAVGSVFDRTTEGLRGRPMIKVAAGAMMVLLIGAGVLVSSRASGNAASVQNAPSPLELMSMRYQRQGTTLTVSGLVKNPAAGTAMNGISAVVFVFDHAGAFVGSGRAPIEYSALTPGDESPFVVTVPNLLDVARYRVAFRNDRGVVRHLDRRPDHVELAQAVR